MAFDDAGHIGEVAKFAEDFSPIFMVRGTDAEAGLLWGTNSTGRAWHELDGGINGFDGLFGGFRIGDAEFVREGDFPVGRATQAILIQLGEGKLYLCGGVRFD